MIRQFQYLMLVFLLGWPLGGRADEALFSIGGVPVRLVEATNEVAVLFQSMRFSRAARVWNVEVVLTNITKAAIQGPFVVLIDSFSGTPGPLQVDGLDANQKPFFNMSATVPSGVLPAGERSAQRTLTLAYSSGAVPHLTARVYAASSSSVEALGLTRTLNETGQPLLDAVVLESGPRGQRTNRTDSITGVVTLGQGPGAHRWIFSSANYLPVWRSQTLLGGEVAVLPNPRLTRRDTNGVAATPQAAGSIASRDGSIQASYASGTFAQSATINLTPLTAQTLPALLPPGWSPLQAFWMDFADAKTRLPLELSPAMSVLLKPWGPIAASESAVLVQWNQNSLGWDVLELVSGKGTNAVAVHLPGKGAFALVAGDADGLNPPVAPVGKPLPARALGLPAYAGLAASGTVEPAVSLASRAAERVTAKATVTITNTAGPLPSGLPLRCEVKEIYRLRDGTRRFSPLYETFLVGYQRPGAQQTATLQAQFPLRPLRLYGAEELEEATLTVEVMAPTAFAGGVLGVQQSSVIVGDVQILAGPGDLASSQAVQIRVLAPGNFSELAGAGASVAGAFELTVGGVAPGRRLGIQWSGVPTNGVFVLARVLAENGYYGLQPIERLASDTAGRLRSLESPAGDRLSGIDGAGQYVLTQVNGPQGLVTGTVRNGDGKLAAGLPVRIQGQPWLALSATDGSYRLVSPAGRVEVAATDPASGDSGFASITVADAQTPARADVSAAPSGPRVAKVTPADGAMNVARVTSVAVEFSKPINPGSLGAAGIQLMDTNNQPVAASLTLNLANTVATLLPTAQLSPMARHAIRISTNLTDLAGRRLEGADAFLFTTVGDALNRAGAQVTSYEPGTNGLARMSGTPGIAEPEVPVILVNESSGRTATVLSKVDGSFDNFIEADVDDFLSATMVNRNGTRNTIPVSRQLFRDGSVGLFNGGGILEAQSDGGPIQVIIEPGSIETKTKFNLQAVPYGELLAMLGGVQPQNGGQLLSGFKIKTEGDPLKAAASLRMPLNLSALNPPPGKDASDGAYVLTIPGEIEGVKVFQFVEDMNYKSGFLESSMPGEAATNTAAGTSAFLGKSTARDAKANTLFRSLSSARSLAPSSTRTTLSPILGDNTGNDSQTFMAIAMSFAGRMSVSGQFLSWNSDHTDERPVPGGTIFINPSALGGLTDRQVPAGALVVTANNYGAYTLSVWAHQEAFYLFGMSVLYPGKIGVGTANPVILAGNKVSPIVRGTLHIERNATATQPDYVAPRISVISTPSPALTDTDIEVQVLATDNRAVTRVQAILHRWQGNTTFVADGNPITQGQSMRRNYRARTPTPQRLVFQILADDGSGNRAELLYSLDVYKAVAPPANPNDHTGPKVTSTTPADGAQNVDRYAGIYVSFSEPVDPGFTNDMTRIESAIRISPAAGTPRIQLGFPNNNSMLVEYPQMTGNTDYTVTIGNGIKDVNNNALDQLDSNGGHASTYSFKFKTWNDLPQNLPNMKDGAGVVGQGAYLFALDKVNDKNSVLRIYHKEAGVPNLIMNVGSLPEYPRSLVFIPGFSYYDAQLRKHRKDFVAAVGGELGVDTSRQWLWLIDVTDPYSPQTEVKTHIIRSPTAAVVKLAWSSPVLGFLQYDANTVDGIGLIDLQLLLYSNGLANYDNEPMNGQAGIDANGNGNYTDDLETIPRPSRRMLRDGIFNAGLVGGYNLGDTFWGTITDFDIAFGGRFAAVVHSASSNAGVNAAYRTVAVNGEQLPLTTGFYDQFTQTPSRLLLLFGISVRITEPKLYNLAFVSGGKPGTVTVLDITNPQRPTRFSEFVVPPAIGEPKSAIYVPARSDQPAWIVLSGTKAALVLDPAFLWSYGSVNNPTFLGTIPGVGNSSRSFYFDGSNLFAVSQGARNLLEVIAPGPVEVVSIDASDENDNGTVRHSRNGELDIVLGFDNLALLPSFLQSLFRMAGKQDMMFAAKFFPDNASPRPGFPNWLFDGADPKMGRGAQYTVPGYKPPAGNWTKIYLGDVEPNIHNIQCEQNNLTLRVYPGEKIELRITDALWQGFAFIDKVQTAVNQGLSSLAFGFSGGLTPLTPRGKFNFINQWKERAGDNRAGYTFDIQVMADPLVGFRGRLTYGFSPPRGLADLVHAYVYLGMDLKLMLRGGMSRDEQGRHTGTIVGGVEVPVQVGLDAKLASVAEIALMAESKLVGNDRLILNPSTDTSPATFVDKSNVDFTGVRGKITVKLLNGIIEYQQEVNVINGGPVIREREFEIYRFSP